MEAGMPPVIEVDNAWIRYPGGRRIWFPELQVDGPGVRLILGRNGSGKTSFLRTIAGLVPWFAPEGTVYGGRVSVNGVDPRREPEGLHGIVGFLPPDPDLYILGPTPVDDVLYTFRLAGREASMDSALELLELYGVPRREAFKPVTELSSGYRQRTALASLAGLGVGCWLLDEPTSHIDPSDRGRLLSLLHDEARRRCLLVSTHYRSYYMPVGVYVLGDYEEPRKCDVGDMKGGGGGVLLEARDVWYGYPGGEPVLRGASIKVEAGLVHVIRGANGSGKSTLLKVMAGGYKPWRGSVEGAGKAAYLPSNPILAFSRPTLRDELGDAGLRDAPAELVEGIVEKPVGVMSSGELKRAAIALVVSLGYRVLLLDEPEAGLDPEGRCALARILRVLSGMGYGVVVVSHDDEWSRLVGDVWYEIRGGEVVEL